MFGGEFVRHRKDFFWEYNHQIFKWRPVSSKHLLKGHLVFTHEIETLAYIDFVPDIRNPFYNMKISNKYDWYALEDTFRVWELVGMLSSNISTIIRVYIHKYIYIYIYIYTYCKLLDFVTCNATTHILQIGNGQWRSRFYVSAVCQSNNDQTAL